MKSMFRTFKRIINEMASAEPRESRHLQLAVAVLLHEARRADYDEGSDETDVGEAALIDLFGVAPNEARELLAHGRERAGQERSFYAPLTTIKRDFGPEMRARLIEHLWRISFADGQLNLYEDHYVRKIAHLLYVPHTDSMLARNRARDAVLSRS